MSYPDLSIFCDLKHETTMKHSAVLFKSKNKIIRISTNNLSYHAEHNVIKNVKSFEGLSILVIRYNKSNQLADSRPCNNCIDILNSAGIKKIYYSNNEGIIVEEKIKFMERYHVSSKNRIANKTTKSSFNRLLYVIKNNSSSHKKSIRMRNL